MKAALITVAGLAVLAACTPDTSAQVPSGCVDTEGENDVVAGQVHAGPFELDKADWTAPRGAKFWFGVTSDGEPDRADLRAVPLDRPGEPVVEHRASDRTTAGDLRSFYPGLVKLPHAGTWRFDITVGPDHGCFLVHVPGAPTG